MIPDIGLMIAAYIVLRSAEALVHLSPTAGIHGRLESGPRTVIGILALGALAVALICGWDLRARGTESAEGVSAFHRMRTP